MTSRNVVHNFGKVKKGKDDKPFDWAIAFDQLVEKSI